jgi:hypothetical protein
MSIGSDLKLQKENFKKGVSGWARKEGSYGYRGDEDF